MSLSTPLMSNAPTAAFLFDAAAALSSETMYLAVPSMVLSATFPVRPSVTMTS